MSLKLPFFPMPYKDELLYSAISRYHLWSRNPFPTNTNMDLFDSKTMKAKIGFPNGLETLIEKLPTKSDNFITNIIQYNTLYPLYHPFLDEKDSDNIINELMKKNGKATSLAGVIQSKIPIPRYLRYCEKCLLDDERKFGEPYWHRTHQVFGVNICHVHKEWLIESTIEAFDLKKANVYSPLNKNVGRLQSLDQGEFEKHLKLSMMVCDLLNTRLSFSVNQKLKEKYLFFLKQKDLATFKGVIKERQLIEQFVEFYGVGYLKAVHSDVNVNTRNNWVNLITRPKSKVHPIRHLLLINFLGITLEEFFSIKVEDENPFGKGPWICFNAASSHYLKPVINEITIKRGTHTKLPVGVFKCDCGFIYSKTYSEKGKMNNQLGRIISFGPTWIEELVRLKNVEKKTIREIAKELHVTPLTVIRKLRNFNGDEEDKKIDKEVDEELMQKHQKHWSDLVNKFPNKSITELRNTAKASYIWLYRNNKSWLESNTPTIKRKSKVGNYVDWKKRDIEFNQKIPPVVSIIRNKSGRPVRLTCCSIGKELGIYPILQYGLNLLPKTKRTIEKYVETVEQFQIRRVQWAAEELQKNGECVTASKIMKKASLAPHKINKEVLTKVNEVASEF